MTLSDTNYTKRSNLLDLEPIHLLYDERMLLHRPIGWVEPTVFPEYPDEVEEDYPMENPERLRVIYERLCDLKERLQYEEDTDTVFRPLQCEMATKEQITLAHSEEQYERLNRLQRQTDRELIMLSGEMTQSDIYYNQESFIAARLAAGGLIECVDAACENRSDTNKALALVRPPGHHACQEKEMGFCFIDSVVVAAKYALAQKKAKKICILDWDIHDGNGTSEATIDNEDILRIDVHRYNTREGFYPYTGSPHEVGSGKAKGLNCNMTWSNGGMGNTEYAAAFFELVLPLLADYKPDLLIISCGLDAAMGDLLGGCEVTPDFFHAMTRATLECVGPDTPVVCALEGGYTMSVLPDCMEAVTLAMLNCPYRYHSSLELGNYIGGATQETRHTVWPTDPLERSRRVLSKYYIRDGCSMILTSAVHDINLCIRIFKSISRWSNLQLHKIKSPHTKPKGNKRKWVEQHQSLFEPSPQRPQSYRKEQLQQGKTHVAVGFVDLGILLAAELTDGNGPLRFLGIETSPYTVAKTHVIWELIKGTSLTPNQSANQKRIVLQVWFSAAWAKGTESAVKGVLSELCQADKSDSYHPKVRRILNYWRNAPTCTRSRNLGGNIRGYFGKGAAQS